MRGHRTANAVTTVLVVEDDVALRQQLGSKIRSRGFDVLDVATGNDALAVAADGRADVVVLDLRLPDLDGLDVLQRLREVTEVPVIVLTKRDRKSDKARLLDAGADDYITAPFDFDELDARLRAALRERAGTVTAETIVRAGDVEVDLATKRVTRAGALVHLTRTERNLLEELVRNPGKLLTHERLLHAVWGTEYGTESNYLRVYVAQLRKKLGDDATKPRLIVTEPGIGYRWIAAEPGP